MANIGTTNSSVAYLIEVLLKLAQGIDDEVDQMGPPDRRAHNLKVEAAKGRLARPDFSAFHSRFRGETEEGTTEGHSGGVLPRLRRPPVRVPDRGGDDRADRRRHDVVPATFVTPYPPGFPILLPGQLVSRDILDYVRALDTREIHGYAHGLGYRVVCQAALA